MGEGDVGGIFHQFHQSFLSTEAGKSIEHFDHQGSPPPPAVHRFGGIFEFGTQLVHTPPGSIMVDEIGTNMLFGSK